MIAEIADALYEDGAGNAALDGARREQCEAMAHVVAAAVRSRLLADDAVEAAVRAVWGSMASERNWEDARAALTAALDAAEGKRP